VFAETSNGPTALAVTVRRDRSGSVYVDGFPAIVGTPPVARAGVARTREPIDNTELAATASRAVRNYVAARRDALAADLLPGALAVVPDVAMRATTIEEMTWSLPGRAIDVVVRARLSTGGELALAYELGVVRQASRWFVRWIETQPRED
jgi:hypothetical protein